MATQKRCVNQVSIFTTFLKDRLRLEGGPLLDQDVLVLDKVTHIDVGLGRPSLILRDGL